MALDISILIILMPIICQTNGLGQTVHYLQKLNTGYNIVAVVVNNFQTNNEPFKSQWHAKAIWDGQNYNKTG
jgi:hypothetical protein